MSEIKNKTELMGLSPASLEAMAINLGEKAFRGRQLAEWFYKRRVRDFESMDTLSRNFREILKKECKASGLTIHRRQESQRDGTTKYLLKCSDGELIEAVALPHEGRTTACISTQVGCAMGCTFCATGDSGFARNLTAGEIVGQVITIEADRGEAIDNLVFMGMGEPLHNWPQVKETLETLCSPGAFAWGPRRITLSTCGLAPEIRLLADSGLKPRLAVSLHAGDDKTRTKIMPINKRFDLAELMDACKYYQTKTGLQVTFELAIFKGVNDTKEAAQAIIDCVRGLECKVNIIPYNPVAGLGFEAPDYKDVVVVQMALKKAGIITMIRTEKGGDIDAACGQLRRREVEA